MKKQKFVIVENQSASFFKNRVGVVMVAGLFLLILLAVFFITQNINKALPIINTKTEIDVTVIEESLRSIAELSTLSYQYSDVGVFNEQKFVSLFGNEIGIPGTTKSFIITYDGEMKFGIDLSNVSVRDNNKILSVMLPPAQMLSHAIREDSIKLLDEKSGLFTSFSMTDYTDFMIEQKEKMEARALERNYLEQAQSNAERHIEALMLSMPGIAGEYQIRFVNN